LSSLKVLEFKDNVVEEIEFYLIQATRSGKTDFVSGLEKALEIIEEIYNGQ
jgi:uncharacterized sporulation protein YeaH/YhbH (DUF444 family)